MPLNMEVIEIEDLVNDCSRFIIGAVGLNDIGYETNVPSYLRPLRADKRALKQILINLLSNSVKYTPNGGQITLSVKLSNGHHIFQIRDNGVGITEKKLRYITEPFFREKTDPHKSEEGTGLGLAIVKSLVDLHEGDLTIESVYGKGTVVTVALPSNMD